MNVGPCERKGAKFELGGGDPMFVQFIEAKIFCQFY
jgi:hypothetical protein